MATAVPSAFDTPYPGDACFVGILGGMGPMAGAAFAARLVAMTPAGHDQFHIPAVLRNDPRIPDRSSARMGNGPDPLPALLRGARDLQSRGVALIAMPCNTAHFWYEEMATALRVPVLHIVDAVIADLRRQGITQGRIGVMGTRATLRQGLYQARLENAGYTCELLNEADMEQYSLAAIEAVKANDLASSIAPAAEGIQILRNQGVDAVVLGCTELPLAVPHALRPAMDVVLSDSLDALALAVIERYRQSHGPLAAP